MDRHIIEGTGRYRRPTMGCALKKTDQQIYLEPLKIVPEIKPEDLTTSGEYQITDNNIERYITLTFPHSINT